MAQYIQRDKRKTSIGKNALPNKATTQMSKRNIEFTDKEKLKQFSMTKLVLQEIYNS